MHAIWPTTNDQRPTTVFSNSALENFLGEIPLSGIGDDGYDPFPCPESSRDLQRCEYRCPAARARKDAFFRSQQIYCGECVVIVHHQDFVANCRIEILW